MKKLAAMLRQVTFGKKPAVTTTPVEHPNFWMYR